MASFNLHTLLRQVRRLDPQAPGVPTDAQLLDRLVAHGDEAAFEVVVWRHGPMVLSVCRRVLHQEQDAEDAFQATFLALVRKASSIHRYDAVASWLYKVAHRIALRARAIATQRSAVEKQVAIDASSVAEVDRAWRDLRPVLDLEVNRLPERYRLPLVLCYFEGRTTDEAARQLGCPRGTVLSRLARARERLRGRLSRRGLALSAGLLATSLTELAAPATLSAALVESAVRTCVAMGAGAVAAPVAALTEGVLRAMFLNKLKLTAAVVLATGLLAAGTALVTHQALATQKGDTLAKAQPAPAPDVAEKKAATLAKPKQETHPITVSGTAVNSQGERLKGVTVYLLSTNGVESVLGSTKTDADGHYAFKDAPLPIRRFEQPGAQASGTFQVCGVAPGYGFAWHGMRYFHPGPRPANWNPANEDYSCFKDERIEMKLKLEPAAKLHGRLVDEAGKPVASAKIRLRNADYFDVAGKEKHINFREFWGIGSVPETLTSAVTDKDGRFQIDGLPPEVVFWTWVEHPDFSPLTLYAVTTDRKVTERDYESGQKQPVHSGALDLALAKPRRVLVYAVYGDSGKAAPGIHIGTGGAGASAVGYSAWGTTDADGKLILRLPPGDYRLVADPKGDLPCIRTQRTLTVAATPDQQPYELRMDAGCVLILEVVDEATGKGIPSVEFGQEWQEGAEIFYTRADGATGRVTSSFSDADGRLRLVVQPGKRKYTVDFGTLPQDYEIVPEADDVPGKPGAKEVELPAGKTVHVKFKLRKK
jgi:RNA polymerase sigma factor (sigma-70 family)